MIVKIFQNKITVGIACIVIAGVMAFVLLPSINKGKNGTVMVYKLRESIAAGTQINDEMLVEQEVGRYGLPDSLVKEKENIAGKFAACDIAPDDLILSSKLSDFAASQELDRVMNDGKMLVTVSLNSVAAAVGNHLKSGDIISIIGYANDKVNSFDELQNLEVYSVENDDAQNIDDVGEDEDKIAANVTLIVDKAQAEKLVLAEYSGKVHAVFMRRGA